MHIQRNALVRAGSKVDESRLRLSRYTAASAIVAERARSESATDMMRVDWELCSPNYSGSLFVNSTSRFINPNAADRIGPPIGSWFNASTGPFPR